MNDAINKLNLRLRSLLKPFSKEIQDEVRDVVEDLVELNVKAVKNLQLYDVHAWRLRKGDIIIDPSKRTLHKVSYSAKRNECQFNVPEGNTEVLVMYGEDEPSDYFDMNSIVTILVDIGELVHINKRTFEELEEDF